MTPAEYRLWYFLRAKRFYNLKFRRQHPIGGYITDFCCLEKMIIAEVDGGHHAEDEQREYDQERTMYLEAQGYKVVRFWNNDIFSSIDGVLERLYFEIFEEEELF